MEIRCEASLWEGHSLRSMIYFNLYGASIFYYDSTNNRTHLQDSVNRLNRSAYEYLQSDTLTEICYKKNKEENYQKY